MPRTSPFRPGLVSLPKILVNWAAYYYQSITYNFMPSIRLMSRYDNGTFHRRKTTAEIILEFSLHCVDCQFQHHDHEESVTTQ